MNEIQDNKKTYILLLGIIGSIGAFMILIADIVYNIFNGNRLGSGLYITTYFGVFVFPLWWAGIFVIYKGLKPAGFFWSFIPCLLLAFNESTINVFLHSSFLYRAIINNALNSTNSAVIEAVEHMKTLIKQYTGFIGIISNCLELTISIWFAIPILRGKTYFPRWMAFLIPIFPFILSLVIDVIFKGFFKIVEPYLGSGFMFIIFILSTIILNNKVSKFSKS